MMPDTRLLMICCQLVTKQALFISYSFIWICGRADRQTHRIRDKETLRTSWIQLLPTHPKFIAWVYNTFTFTMISTDHIMPNTYTSFQVAVSMKTSMSLEHKQLVVSHLSFQWHPPSGPATCRSWWRVSLKWKMSLQQAMLVFLRKISEDFACLEAYPVIDGGVAVTYSQTLWWMAGPDKEWYGTQCSMGCKKYQDGFLEKRWYSSA